MKKSDDTKLLKLWKAKVREDAGNQCELCGSSTSQLHPHHFVGRRNRATRWYLPNGILLCASHHTMGLWSAHDNPEWFRKQILDIRGEKWLRDLMLQSNKTFKGDYDIVKSYLDEERKNYV